jgi:hypothetical protein
MISPPATLFEPMKKKLAVINVYRIKSIYYLREGGRGE